MQQVAVQAAAAQEAAAAADAEYAGGQEELELLMKERAQRETAAGEASAAVEAANQQLADALQLKQAAEAALEVRLFSPLIACRTAPCATYVLTKRHTHNTTHNSLNLDCSRQIVLWALILGTRLMSQQLCMRTICTVGSACFVYSCLAHL